MTIRLVTFDLDNTLWHVDTVIRRAEKETRNWIQPRVPEYASCMTTENVASLRAQVMEENPDIRHDVSELRIQMMRRAFEQCGLSSTEASAKAREAFAVFIRWRNTITFYDGAQDTLNTLSHRYQLAALTNGNADVQKIGLDSYFSFAISAADVGASKPSPEMFLEAMRRAEVSPAHAVHIGDHPIDDIEGANRVGMHSIWVNFDGKTDQVPAHATVTDLPSLVGAILALEGS